ncbi:MAG TPA: amidase, partial [Rhodothermales bacterium]|nr:amidase [Rhodothermales bacterium]
MKIEDQPLHALTAVAVRDAIGQGKATAVDVAMACLDHIETIDPSIRAWVHLNRERARQQARAADEKQKSGRAGPMAGVPVGVKDLFNTYDMPTQMGSPIWAGFSPGNDARVVHYLRMADVVVLGKTVTAEFAVHAPGPTHNPHRVGYMPGTSSSGSAAAVAAYMVPVALGTQTAGSTIRPASYCGVIGFKPSFGLVPRTGMLKTTDTLDTVGWFARSIDDIELVFETIRVKGPDYPVTERALADVSRRRRADRPWRVGVVHGPKWNDAEPYAQCALLEMADELQKENDVEIRHVELPGEYALVHDIHSVIYDRA